MEEATHLAIALVTAESVWRITHCNLVKYFSHDEYHPEIMFCSTYVLCMIAILLDLKSMTFFKSSLIRNIITVLHGADGFIAFGMGIGIYYQNSLLLAMSIILISKFFLLHLLSRMVTGVKAHDKLAIMLQTTKTYIHHTASFYFISDPTTALLTGFWRFISMNGHAAMTLKGKLSESSYDRIMWNITHARNLFMLFIIYLCYYYDSIRRGFALSAIGHVSYMIVRLGPVFRIASLYFPDEKSRTEWSSLSDFERLKQLLFFKHPWLLLELFLLLITSIYFVYLRLHIIPDVDFDNCSLS